MAWVQEYIDSGVEPLDASKRVFEDVLSAGQAGELLAIIGAAPIHRLWTEHQRHEREPITRLQGQRRVNPADLTGQDSLLEAMWDIDGRWVRLGDVTKELAKLAEKQYRNLASANEHHACWFAAIAKALKGAEIVRVKFSAESLRALFEQTRP